MPFEPGDVDRLIETIWTVVLGCNVRQVSTPLNIAADENLLTAMVGITGAWEGVVAIECPEGFARQAASAMFEIEPGLVTVEQAEDALCELTNIVGGNFKALLPLSSHLGLPTVVREPDSR